MVMNSSDFLKDVEELKERRIIVNDVEVVTATGLSPTMVSLYMSGKRPASRKFLQKFYEKYEKKLKRNENIDENLTPVIKTNDINQSTDRRTTSTKSSTKKLKTELGAFDTSNLMYVPFINQYAYAGYLSGYGDQEFMDTLTKIPFIVDKEYKGNYICLEVKGDSMDDGTKDSYSQGDHVLLREIQPDHWRNKLHIKEWDFVIVHDESMVLKKITNHDIEKGLITCHSLNSMYPDFVLDLREVRQIFNVIKHVKNK